MALSPEIHETIRTICSTIVAVAAIIAPIFANKKNNSSQTVQPSDTSERRKEERHFLLRMIGFVHAISLALFVVLILMGFSDNQGFMIFAGFTYLGSGIWVLSVYSGELNRS